jgi:Asp-tRNA(Asn)/Glu-tRNA(Gln) amidotransferase A subunit family amidase
MIAKAPKSAPSGRELCFLTVAEAARLIKARKLSPVELTDAVIQRI